MSQAPAPARASVAATVVLSIACVLWACDSPGPAVAVSSAPHAGPVAGWRPGPGPRHSATAPRLTRLAGQAHPSLRAGDLLSGLRPIELLAGAELSADAGRTRFRFVGPARFGFTRQEQPAALLGQGGFAVQRSAGGTASLSRLALPCTVLWATGPVVLVGAASRARAWLEVLSGSVRLLPQGQRLLPGDGARCELGAVAPRQAGPGDLRARLAALQPPVEDQPLAPDASAAWQARLERELSDALRRFESAMAAGPVRGREAPLARRKQLARLAAERLEARRALDTALARLEALSLLDDPLFPPPDLTRARAALGLDLRVP